uniref:Uncharacterized protein n=1 Tax=viral metagenome TaxID=1070528 RepID=A0A6C0D344_9ZZZZ
MTNRNISISNGYVRGNIIGTTIVRATANNLFTQMIITIKPKTDLKKMTFTK